MMNGYLSYDSQVLLANGNYKNIATIEPGDLILNLRGEPTKVIRVEQSQQKTVMTEIRYQNWYTPFYCTPTEQLLVAEPSDNEWKLASDIHSGQVFSSGHNIYQTLLPEEFSIPLTTSTTVVLLRPTYDLGLIIGLYAGYGGIVDNCVEFRFGPNKDLVEKVSALLESLFKAKADIVKNEYCYLVQSYDKHLLDLFTPFNSKINREIPRCYWSSNSDYVRGLFDGLVEYDDEKNVSRYIPVSTGMAQAFLWVCSLLDIGFDNDTPALDKQTMNVFPLFVQHRHAAAAVGKITSVTTQSTVEQCGWNLQVECSSNSFIANNLVVQGLADSQNTT